MSQGRRTAISFAGFRRLVAMLSAFAFLTVGMAHAIIECDGFGAGTQTIVSNVAPDQPAGPVGHAVPCDHCYGCTGAMTPLVCTSVFVGRIETDFVIAAAAPLGAHAPGFQTPPPKSLT
ncbi:MAG: hypothetical protein AB1490_11840 [Pseudomonadota bacterium]